jgi:hypothetical protein
MDKKIKVFSIDELKKKLKKEKKNIEKREQLEPEKIEKEIKKEKKKQKEDLNKKTIFEIQKYSAKIKELDSKIEKLQDKIMELEDKLISLDIDEDSESIKNLGKNIRSFKSKLKELTSEKEKLISFINELSKVKSGIEKGEEDIIDEDEKKVLKVMKEINDNKEQSIKEGRKFNSIFLRDKIDELLSKGELREENEKVLKEIYKLSSKQIFNFYNQYLRKDENFFSLLEKYINILYSPEVPELEELSKEQLLSLAEKQGILQSLKNKSKKEIIQILKSDKCNPDLNILCLKEGKVCDISKNLCVSKPDKIPDSYILQLYKNSFLYGPIRAVKELNERLKKIGKYEEQRLKEKGLVPLKEKIIYKDQKAISKIEKSSMILLNEISKSSDQVVKKDYFDVFKYDDSCLEDFSKRLWIPNLKTVYISNSDGSKPDRKFITEDSIEYKEETFYKPTKRFHLLNCNKYRNERKQVDNIFSVYDENGKLLSFKILYELANNKFKFQTEDEFKKENEYLSKQRTTLVSKLEQIKSITFSESSTINTLIRNVVIDKLKKNLNNLLVQEKSKLKEDDIKFAKEMIISNIEKDFEKIIEKYSDKSFDLERTFKRIVNDIQDMKNLKEIESYLSDLKISVEEKDYSYKEYLSNSISSLINETEQIQDKQNVELEKLSLIDPEEIAKDIEDGIRESLDDNDNMETYLLKVANILIFIDSSLESSKYPISFRSKLIRGFFEPSFFEKIDYNLIVPEIFSNKNIDEEVKNKVIINLEKETDNSSLDLLRSLYIIINPTEKVIDLSGLKHKLSYSLLKGVERIKCPKTNEFEEWEQISYLEDGVLYCFDIYTILSNFLVGDFSNPNTGKKFSDKFITFVDNWNVERITEPKVKIVIKEPDVKVENPLLVEIISRLKKAIQQDEKKISLEEGEDICKYCDKVLIEEDEKYQSVIKSEFGANIITFCSLKCFENASFRKEK